MYAQRACNETVLLLLTKDFTFEDSLLLVLLEEYPGRDLGKIGPVAKRLTFRDPIEPHSNRLRIDARDVEALYKECTKAEYLGNVLRSMFGASGSKVAIAPTDDANSSALPQATSTVKAPTAATEEEEEEHLEETVEETPAAEEKDAGETSGGAWTATHNGDSGARGGPD